MAMTRQEHLKWAKDRALEYVAQDDVAAAWASFSSDMCKHEELRSHPALRLVSQMVFGGRVTTADQIRREIDGFG